jgi:hypothetical protein
MPIPNPNEYEKVPPFEEIINRIINQWQEDVALSKEDPDALRIKARYGRDMYVNKFNNPSAADWYFKRFSPLVDKAGESIKILTKLRDDFRNKGYGHIVSNYPPDVTNVPENALGVYKDKVVMNSLRQNPFYGTIRQSIGVNPEAKSPNLENTILHEFTHYMQEHPETKEVLKNYRNYPGYKENTGNAYLDNYLENPYEIQARQMASAFMEDLYGIRTADNEPSGKDALNELIGRGVSPSPTNIGPLRNSLRF